MYRLLRSVLFLVQPEKIHTFTLKSLRAVRSIPLSGRVLRTLFCYHRHKDLLKREVFGIPFENPVGLAAGLDKNGDAVDDLANFGFGFIEIGSLTPEPQTGNSKPRVFRLVKDGALINRMGINNLGIKHAVGALRKNKHRCVVGCSIAKGTKTSTEEAVKDFERCFEYIYDYVDYIALNLSCPNVKGLSKLQESENLSPIIDRLVGLRTMYDDYRPILLKISPDLSDEQLDEIIDLILISGLDGVIATNTTLDRDSLSPASDALAKKFGEGGLSGKPLFAKSLRMVKYISEKTKGNLPIIACGGIMTPSQAAQMLEAGASLVQVYTGFIYNGPSFARKICKYLVKHSK